MIVGGGLAGLTCAYRLQQAGYVADVYEASTRIGGRCWSGRAGAADNPFVQGQVFEHGGELIDQGHTQVRKLAQELGLDPRQPARRRRRTAPRRSATSTGARTRTPR